VGLIKTASGWHSASVSYPEPIFKTLGFQSGALALYEGQARISMNLRRTDATLAMPLVPVEIQLQACDDRVCLPPERRLLHVPMMRPTAE